MAAIVVLLLIVLLVVWLISALTGGGDEPQPTATEGTAGSSSVAPGTTSAQTSTTSTTAPDEERDSGKRDSGDAGVRPTTEAESRKPYAEPGQPAPGQGTDEPKATCDLSDLIVTATSDQAAYAPDVQPRFYMTVKNPTAADCMIDLGKDVLRFEVYDLATNRRVWSDVDCNPAVDVTERRFPAGEERYYEAIWSRTNSAPGSCGDRVQVPVGSYYLHTLVGGNHSDAHPFNLR